MLRAVHSLLHPDDLAALAEREYALPAPVRVRLLCRGFNDTYQLTDATGTRWALRLYSTHKYWIEGESDIRFELELLAYLAGAGQPVAQPVPLRSQDLLGRLSAAEGERWYALFSWAPGRYGWDQLGTAELAGLGARVARLHRAMNGFDSSHHRYHLDLDILVGMAEAEFGRRFGDDPGSGFTELVELIERVKVTVGGLDLPADGYGLIHADIHPGNLSVTDDGEFVLFDFDHCGFGWRAYDLATFYPGPDASAEAIDRWQAYLTGYSEVRPLSSAELSAMPAFAACRRLWDLGDWLRAAIWNGDGWCDPATCRRLVDKVRAILDKPYDSAGEGTLGPAS